MSKYHVISCSEDGDIYVSSVSKEELLIRIEEEYYGPIECYIDEIKDGNPMYWGGKKLLIIKGDIVVPEPKTIIESWDIA